MVADRFELVRRAGAGGMAAVWRARDRNSGEPVALKVLHSTSERLIARFEREADLLGELAHPHVVRFVSRGRTADGTAFFAMEWLEGEDLAQRLARKPLSKLEAVEVAGATAGALAVAHARGIVHRDVKPSNIFLVDGDAARAKVVDFGIARWTRSARALTMQGSALGTPGYMAPEQARGEPAVDARADVFALGCVLFECLTGRPAFVADNLVGLLARVLLDLVPAPSAVVDGLPPRLDALVARMLAKEPEHRPRDGREVAHSLRPILAELRMSAGRDDGPRPSDRPDAITDDEQRFVCVIVVGEVTGEAYEPLATLSDAEAERADALSGLVTRFGGRLESLAPGAMAILVESHGSATEQAARAARCALAVRNLLSDVPVTLATGRAVLAGKRPLGEAVDRAVRLNDGAARTAVRIDELTAGLLGAAFVVDEEGSGFALRGEREREVAVLVRTVAGRTPPFVGRRRELAAVEAAWAACLEESQAQTVLVVGEAGMGKSRLVYESVTRLLQLEPTTVVWRMQGEPLSAASPFGSLARMLRRELSLYEGEALSSLQRRLRAQVAGRTRAVDAERIAWFVGECVSIPFPEEESPQLRAARHDARLMGDQVRRACLDLLDAESALGPRILLVEDLHWVDESSVSLVSAALRRLAQRPFLVVGTGRPEVRERFPRLWADVPSIELALRELPARAAAHLVTAAAGEAIDEPRVRELVERSGGNPFHLEELVRAAVAGRGESAPGTVLAVAQVRLESLDADRRRILRAASAFGDTFWSGAVAALVDDDTGRVEEWLASLEREEIVTRSEPSRFPSQPQWGFRHGLLQEAAYSMLTDADRALAHRLAGRWLERAGEGDPRVIAQQLERGVEPRESVPWHARSARAALEATDWGAALASARRALELGATGDAATSLHLTCAEAHHWLGEFPQGMAEARRAFEGARPATEAWYWAASWIGRLAQRRGGLADLEEIAEALPPDASGEAAASAMIQLGVALTMANRGETGASLVERAGQDPSALHPSLEGYLHRARGTVATYVDGDSVAFLQHSRAAVAAFDAAGDVLAACAQRSNVGYGCIELGLYAEAEAELRTALAQTERAGVDPMVANPVRNTLAIALRGLGRLEEARGLADEVVRAFAAQGDRRMETDARSNLAAILLESGELEEAEEQARAAIAASEGIAPMRPKAVAALGRVFLAQGRLGEARIVATEAWELIERLAATTPDEIGVGLLHAETLWATGDEDGARAAVVEAARRLRQRAERIGRSAWRESYLRDIPEHARTLKLAEGRAAW